MRYRLLIVLVIAVIFLVLYLIEKYSYPVVYKVCDLSYKDCSVIAKFKDRNDCETTNKEMGLVL